MMKTLLITVAAFVIVFGTLAVYINYRLKPILSSEIKSLVSSATEELYHIEFSDVTVNCITGDATLRNVKLIPDTAVLRKLIALKRAPNNIYHIQMRKLSVINVHPWKVYRQQRLNIDQVEINHPTITMVNKQYDFNENKPPRPEVSPYEMVSKYLKEVRISKIEFKDASFTYVDQNTVVPFKNSLKHFNVTMDDWLIDSTSATDTSRFYLLKDLSLQLNDYQLATADSLYYVQANSMKFRASTGVLDIKRLSLIPRYDEMEFGKKPGSRKDRFSLELNNLDFKGIDLPLYVKRQELMAREMNISHGRIAVFCNNEIQSPDKPAKTLFPHQLLQTIAAKITIGKLNLSHFDVHYSEYNTERKEKGKISFERTSGWISNITNVALQKEKNPMMEAKLKTYLMGQGELETNFKFNLLAPDGAFSYSGTLHGLNGTVLNGITKPLGMVHIKSGMVKKLQFDIAANARQAKGKMEFNYHDLAIAVLKKDAGDPWYSRQGLLSFLANNMIIKPSNPDHLGLFTTADIDYMRKPNSGFFSYVWKSLFQGIRTSVGATPQKEAMMKAHISKFEKIKEEREKRKAARERRRGMK